MAKSNKATLRQSDLNEFLFAQVGTEANGMTLTLLSLFARGGNDAWVEARRLAGLPKPEARLRLAQTIAAVARSPWQLPEATTIAERLVDLLPVQTVATSSGMGRIMANWSRLGRRA